MPEVNVIELGKTYRIKGKSRYFARKYGTANPLIRVVEAIDYHKEFNPPTFLYIGRMLAEDLPTDGNTYYGHINKLGELFVGEFVHRTELEEKEVNNG